MRRVSLGTVALAALVYGAGCAWLYSIQRSLIYFPTPARPLPQAQLVDLPSGGETLRIWARPLAAPGAVIYFGGNAEDVAGNFDEFAGAFPDRALYLVNYRGYGGSTGTPSEPALFADALAVFDWVRAKHADVAVIGCSLGSGVAVHLAARRPVSRLVLVTPFDSILNVARGLYLSWLVPIPALLQDRFDSASQVPDVKAPTLIVVAENDEVIPRARTEALIAKFPPGQARVEVIRGAGHNDLALHPGYLRRLGDFI